MNGSRVLLVKPNSFRDSVQPPIGLGYLASSLRRRGFEVAILDAIRHDLDERDLLRRVLSWEPDAVGTQCFTTDVAATRRLLSGIKLARPGILTMVGGPHPTTNPAGTVGPEVDLGIRGEAEESLPAFLERGLDAGSQRAVFDTLARDPIPGAFWNNGNGFHGNGIARIAELDELPMVSWDLLEPESYPKAPQAAFYEQFPVAPISISRGCPYDCVFCAAQTISGAKMRYRSVENVMEEIAYLHRAHGIREIHVIDDNFTLHRRYVETFCEALLSSDLKLSWTCPNGVRLDTLTKDLLARMRQSGCYALAVGIESGSPRLLRDIEKASTLDVIRERVNLIHESGIHPVGYFILGFPDETRDEMDQTVRLALDLPLRRAQFMLFHPLPGTRAYETIRGRNGLEQVDGSSTSYAQPAYVPRGFTPHSLKNLQRRAFLRFYLRPEKLLALLRDIRSWDHLLQIIGRVYRWMV
ncbi:MAG: B12-binding domain-containing radical SAM protein [Nitrospirae bacterium]|nr:B12-binding domain-containing radical SAM protein [Nitrospirota bacterium]